MLILGCPIDWAGVALNVARPGGSDNSQTSLKKSIYLRGSRIAQTRVFQRWCLCPPLCDFSTWDSLKSVIARLKWSYLTCVNRLALGWTLINRIWPKKLIFWVFLSFWTEKFKFLGLPGRQSGLFFCARWSVWSFSTYCGCHVHWWTLNCSLGEGFLSRNLSLSCFWPLSDRKSGFFRRCGHYLIPLTT